MGEMPEKAGGSLWSLLSVANDRGLKLLDFVKKPFNSGIILARTRL